MGVEIKGKESHVLANDKVRLEDNSLNIAVFIPTSHW